MKSTPRTPVGEAVTNLIPDLFSLSNRMLAAGDRLVRALGLTSARWQILGAIAAAERPQPVAWLARDLGANRQNVQRIVNDLGKEGFVSYETNPHHRRSQLVILTERGKRAYEEAMTLQAPWVDCIAQGMSAKDVDTAHRVVTVLRKRLEAS